MDDKPSAFVDSPEDLMRKARALVDEGRLDPKVAVVLTDIARELSRSREGHATRIRMVADNASEMNALRDEVTMLRKFRTLSWVLSVVLALELGLNLWTLLRR